MVFPKVSLITPTYNEKANLKKNINQIQKNMKDYLYEIIIVDDNSSDGCGELADELAAKYENIKVLHRESKQGLGTAYKSGFYHTKGDLIVSMDSDLSHDATYLPSLIQEARGYDIVIGSRLCEGGNIIGRNKKRDFLTYFANFAIKMITRRPIDDWTSGYRVYSREVWEEIMPLVHCNKWDFQFESLIKAHKRGFSVKEVPIIFLERAEGASKFGLYDVFVFLYSFTKIMLGLK